MIATALPLDYSLAIQAGPRVLWDSDRSGAPLQWSADGRDVFVQRTNLPVVIERVEIATGRREAWKTLRPRDMVGIDRIFPIALTPDGKSYCYTATRNISDLVAVSGVK